MVVAYGYIRVSTLDQANDGNSLDAQKRRVKEYYDRVLKPKGFQWGGFYVDTQSAFKVPLHRRKKGEKLMRRVEAGDLVLASMFDRVFRSVKDYVNTADMLREREVNIYIVNSDGNVVTDTPQAAMQFQMMAVVAEYDSAIKSTRIKEIFAHLKQKYPDRKFGTPKPRVGEKWVGRLGHKRKTKDTHDLKIMEAVYRWHREEGRTLDEIYWHMFREKIMTSRGRAWSRARIYRAIRNYPMFAEQEKQQAVAAETLQEETTNAD